ncbi:hypothetical protein SAMN05428944_5922 [Streptomyces sp. 1222.5]|nr:hypothetical protein BX260_2174 [Streptomyces sp. 5112.2]SEC74358.1 hypothetical protein SAMN05216532_2278 [Streptomyces sp. 2231.1]SED00069.1 hypothetical protein SAMN05428944_5922 [Streptomyces sp. 1222.5]
MRWATRRRFTDPMTTPHRTTVRGAAAGDERDPRAWVAPTAATALMVPLGPLALLFGGLSAMATDSCGPDDCSTALQTALAWIYGILRIGGPITFGALLAAWLLPWKRRWSAARVWAALAALVPPLAVLFLVFTLPAP